MPLHAGHPKCGNSLVCANSRSINREIAKHPCNGRALFGLMESLKRQNKVSSAKMVEGEFKKAWETADTQLRVEDLFGALVAAAPTREAQKGTDPTPKSMVDDPT